MTQASQSRRPLEVAEADAMLATLDGWVIEGKDLIKKLKFKNFVEAQAYVNRLGELAEAANHHPDIRFGWGYADIYLTTHDAGGLTKSDFTMAAKIDAMGQAG